MMCILFILDRVENPASANAQLARRLAAELLRRGHTVHLLELWDGQTPPPAPPPGARGHELSFADERVMNEVLENGRRGGTPVPLRLSRLTAHPAAMVAAFRQLVLHKPRRTVDTKREIERLDAEFHFSAVCAVCAPYRAAFALETASIGAKKLLWQLDPYASNRDYTAPGGYAREAALLEHIDTAFITPQALPDYEGGALSAYRSRVRVLGFPVVEAPAEEKPPAAHAGTRCTFCGSLYPTVREPSFALALFRALNEPDLTLTMAGRGWQPFADEADKTARVLGERFVRYDVLPADDAARLERDADVLLSLGNALDNQMPSKLFGYFALGKPVLHLAVTDADPTLPYLRRYPLALVLFQKDGAAPKTLDALRRWLAQTRGKRLPFAQVAALYPEFTPAAAADAFLQAL